MAVALFSAAACGGSDDVATSDDTAAEQSADDSSSSEDSASDGDATESAGEEPAVEGEPVYGGSLTVGLEANSRPLDPADMGALVDRNVGTAIYDPLIAVDESGEFVPALATEWEISDDATQYTVTLRDGVSFHDGTTMDAAAVVSHFERLMDPETACRCAAQVAIIDSVEATDDLTVTFQLTDPSVAFTAVLADVPGFIASPTAVAASSREAFGGEPVGAGPFQVVEIVDNDRIVLERFDDYWNAPLPYLDELIFRPIPDNQSRYAALQTGDIDILQTPQIENVISAESDDAFDVVELGGLGTTFVMYETQEGPFTDVRARTAATLASDMDTINEEIYLGVYEHTTSVFPDAMNLGIDTPNYPFYDPEAAAALVEEIGGLSFTLAISATPSNLELGEILQAMWADVGIEVEIEQLDQSALIDKAINSDFEAILFRWPGRWDPDLNSYQFFHSESGRNYTRLSVPEVDDLLTEARITTDADTRTALYQDAAVELAEAIPYNFVYALNGFFLTRSEVNGVPAIADWLLRPHTIWVEQ